MHKFHAFILSLLVTVFLANIFYLFQLQNSQTSYAPEVIKINRVIDGDTFQTSDGRIIRLANINSPEKRKSEISGAKSFLESYINSTVELEILGKDRYQRQLARIYAPEYLNLEIIKQGLVSKFLVREKELDLFSSAEREAIENQRGIWKRSVFYSCIETSIDHKKESVMLENFCPNISIEGWYLKDESRAKYTFKVNFIKTITLHSGKGNDTSTDIYWGKSQAIWNDNSY